MSGSSAPTRAGLVVRADRLAEDEITRVRGVAVTTALRTAFDLGRRPVTEAIWPWTRSPRAARSRRTRSRASPSVTAVARGTAQLPEVLRRSSPLADSPMESRIRIAIEDAGLPRRCSSTASGPTCWISPIPQLLLALEYDGRHHLTPERALRDLRRQAYLTAAGWEVLRFPPREVFQPRMVAAPNTCRAGAP